MATEFKWEANDDGVTFRLVERRLFGGARAVPFQRWTDMAAPECLAGIGFVMRLLEERGAETPEAISTDGTSLLVRHDLVAAIQEHQAAGLGLPPSTPLVLGIQSRGDIAQPAFEVSYRWLETAATKALGVREQGSILWHRGVPARLPEPLFGIARAISAFNAADTADDETRFQHLSSLKELIPDGPKAKHGLEVDPYVRDTKIVVASAFSLCLRTGKQGFDFDPVLFGRKLGDAWAESEGAAHIAESESLLPEAVQDRFAKQHFRVWDKCKDKYALGSRYSVYIEPALRAALDVVREVQKSDAETRRKFARNPQAKLKEALADRLDDSAVERMYIATDEYSQRVLDLGVWQPVVLPWIKPQPNSWLPEAFGVMVGDVRIEMKPEDIEPARKTIEEAMARGQDTVKLGEQEVPATSKAIAALDALLGLVRPNAKDQPEPPADQPDPTGDAPPDPVLDKQFLVVDENFESTTYLRDLKRRADFIPSIPDGLKTDLKLHQKEGLSWLQECWCTGFPGCLLADDMGLGKSLQGLAFVLWLSDMRRSLHLEKQPVLIVAPTGLLKNWADESLIHLYEPGLGEPLKVYGTEARRLKVEGKKKNDTLSGESTLRTEEMSAANWVLTSYDTLRDYHLSFAKVRFSAVIYDEVQKIKNPASQWSRAAKTLNGDFTLTMTGTPLENRAEDLWSIMDVAYPGYLPDLKSYSKRYATDDQDALRELGRMMLERIDDKPPVMLRRMKADRLKGLPEKREVPIERTMPLRQAEAYTAAVTQGSTASSAGDMLKTLHAMRGISLHPVDPQQARSYGHDEYIGWSARLSATFEILREIAKKREKVLIFLESLDLQDVLAAMLKREFGLDKQPLLIHGGISGDKRKEFVDQFQDKTSQNRFDVMILSPKSGGVGLTITAANHVIHLSRWWNPAVEDQCTDRAYRIGQDKTVHVYYPMAVHPDPGLAEYSFDLKLNALLQRKRQLSREVLVPPVSAGDESELFTQTVRGGAKRQTHQDDGEAHSLEEIDRMNPTQFERWILRRLSEKGWRANRTPTSGDGGSDGVLSDPAGSVALVQAKHRLGEARCDDEPISNLLKARKLYSLPTAIMYAVTNAKGYTATAKERADRHGISLIDRDNILQWTES